MAHQNKWYPNYIHRVFTDNVTGQDIIRGSLDAYSSKQFDEIDFQIIDFSRATKLSFSKLDIRNLNTIEKVAQKSNWTLVVFIILPDNYNFRGHQWFVNEYGKKTVWRVERFESRSKTFENVGAEITKRFLALRDK